MTIAIEIAIGAIASRMSEWFEGWRVTTHGDNPWTVDSVANVVRLYPWWRRAIAMVEGRVTSCFRSVHVNTLVGGVSTSDHLWARAIDLVPSRVSLEDGARILLDAARAGLLGDVREIGVHKGHIHMGWYPIGKFGSVRHWGFTP